MKRIAPTAAALALTFAFAGCGGAPSKDFPSAHLASKKALATHATGAEASPKATAAPDASQVVAPGRGVGDFITYRFTGKLLKNSATLTEKVLAREPGKITIELTMAAGKNTDTLVVTFADRGEGAHGDALEVSKVDADGNRSGAALADYESFMAKVALAADENEEMLTSEESPRVIGGMELECKSASYKVRIKGKTATLRTLESSAVAWGDLGGEITGEDGTVYYRAEVLGMGRSPIDGEAGGVAKNDAR